MSKKSTKIKPTTTNNIVDELDTELNKLEGKSAKIRYMTSIGMDRKSIAGKLGIRYQHVRNVQCTLLKKDMNKE